MGLQDTQKNLIAAVKQFISFHYKMTNYFADPSLTKHCAPSPMLDKENLLE